MPPRITSVRGSGLISNSGQYRCRARGMVRARPAVPNTASLPATVADPIQTVGVKRPGFGTGGKHIKVIVNAFETNIKDGIIHQYDVAITPNANLSIRTAQQIFHEFQTTVLKTFSHSPMVYDGRNIAFAMSDLQFDAKTGKSGFSVPVRLPGSATEKNYNVQLTMTKAFKTDALRRFLTGQQPQDNSVLMTLTALNVAIRMKPNLELLSSGNSFFTCVGKKNIGAGIELWQGYFQSLRPSQNKMYTNIDVSTGVIYKPTDLLSACIEFLQLRSPTELGQISQQYRDHLGNFFRGLRVRTTYPPERHYVIEGIARTSPRTHMFLKKDGTSTTVENYFRELNVTLKYPLLPCVDMGKDRMIPLELCVIPPEQFMRHPHPENRINDAIQVARKYSPEKRLETIRNRLQKINHSQSPYVRAFGLDISKTPMNVKARVLKPPTLKYGSGRQVTINGQWNMKNVKLFQPVKIKKWVIVIFESTKIFNDRVATEMAKQFVENAKSVGIQIPNITQNNPLIRYGRKDIEGALQDARKDSFMIDNIWPDLVVVVLPTNGDEIHASVKRFGDVKAGVPTQCLKAANCSSADPRYWASVMLKVNAKLGGVNFVLEKSELHDQNHPTIVMGADVSHPPPGAGNKPSFTALVSSVDRHAAKYIPNSRVQRGREEIIINLQEMVANALQKSRSYRKEKEGFDIAPERLIFFRDGVSEGQFQSVLAQELPAIQRACQAEKVNPKITFIIVGKGHHIRMFPSDPSYADKTGNCPVGTTIDEGIGHPIEFDYYQFTHGGLLGTSRPAHYSVIYDENNFTADAMQELSFSLAHVYARATRAVSIPAPVYYADLVCSRSKILYTGVDSTLNPNMEYKMNFM